MLLFIKYLSLKSGAMCIRVYEVHYRNDSHHIDLGTFQMTKRNVVAIVQNLYVLS